jgi:hypothetical protein
LIFARKLADLGLNRFSEVGNHVRIDPICFGEPPNCLGKLPHLAGVNYYHWQVSDDQSLDDRKLESPRRFQNDALRPDASEAFNERLMPRLVVRKRNSLSIRANRYFQQGL